MSHELEPNFKIDKRYCKEIQNFCSSKQSVAQIFNVNEAFPQIQQNQTIITPSVFQDIKNFLQEIHNYGLVGEERDPSNEGQTESKIRNPEQEKIDAIEIPKNLTNDDELEKLTVKYYNQILDAIDASENYLETNAILTYQDFADLKDLISSYKLNSGRCNVCDSLGNCSQASPICLDKPNSGSSSTTPTPSTPTPTTPTYTCTIFESIWNDSGGGDSWSSGDSGDGCPCGGQCLMSEGAASPCTICESCNTYTP